MGSPADALVQEPSAGRAVSDIAIQIVGRVLNAGLGVVVLVLLIRGLGTAGFGSWSTLITVVGLAGAFTDLGFTNVGVTRAAADPEHLPMWLGSLLIVRLGMSILATAGCVVAVAVLGGGHAMLVAGIVLALTIPFGAGSAVTVIFQLQTRNDITIAILTVNSVLWTAGVLAGWLTHQGLIGFAVVFTAVNVFTLLLSMVVALRRTAISFTRWRSRVRTLIRVGVPVSVTTLLVIAYAQIDQVLVYEIDGRRAAGLYAVAYRIFSQAGIIPLSLTTTLYPLLARARSRDRDEVTRLFQHSFDALWMVSVAAVVVVIVCGGPLMAIVFGAEFGQAWTALILLMGAFVCVCLNYLVDAAVLLESLQTYSSLVSLLALALNLGFNLILLPRVGYVGAATTTFATELFVLGLNTWRVTHALDWSPHLGRGARCAAVALVVVAVLIPLRLLGLDPWALLLLSIALYAALVLLVRAVDTDALRSLLHRRAPA